MVALLKLRVWSLCENKCYLSSAKLTTTGETLRIMRQSHNLRQLLPTHLPCMVTVDKWAKAAFASSTASEGL